VKRLRVITDTNKIIWDGHITVMDLKLRKAQRQSIASKEAGR